MTPRNPTGTSQPYKVSPTLIYTARSRLTRSLVNHHPKPSQPFKKTTITPAESGGDNCNLHLIGDNDRDAYTYAGSQQVSDTCALIFDPVTQTFTLDKIDADFTFNLRSTPTNKSAKALAAQYPQLETTAPDPTSSDEDEQSFDATEEVGDPDNPYDWRHFLHRRSSSPEEPLVVIEEAPRPAPSIAPPARRQSRTKIKQRPHHHHHHHRPQPKRASTPPREEADADNEDSDDGGLTIEMDPVTKPRHRFGNAFGNISGEGPISLRSAASSVSPGGGLEIDFGGESSQEEEDAEEEEDEENDDDVPDDVKLPSPLAKGVGMPMQGVEVEEEDDDAGDLEAELEREMEREAEADADGDGEEGGGVGVGVGLGIGGAGGYVEESSSESEEE